MGRYIRRRLLTAIPVFLGITLLVFGMLHLAAGSVLDLMGEGSASSAADKAALEASLGLDRPLPVQYLDWLSGLLRGDLGESYLTGKDVAGLIAQRVGPSLLLTGTGVLLAVAIALPLGILAAWKPGSAWDKAASALSLLSFGVPGFFLCLVGILVFSVFLGWLPAQGMYSDTPRALLICVVNRHQVVRFQEILARFPDTFACVSSVNETWGNFKHVA